MTLSPFRRELHPLPPSHKSIWLVGGVTFVPPLFGPRDVLSSFALPAGRLFSAKRLVALAHSFAEREPSLFFHLQDVGELCRLRFRVLFCKTRLEFFFFGLSEDIAALRRECWLILPISGLVHSPSSMDLESLLDGASPDTWKFPRARSRAFFPDQESPFQRYKEWNPFPVTDPLFVVCCASNFQCCRSPVLSSQSLFFLVPCP